MYVVLSYDIGTRRVHRALKICRKYLKHVHRSVFEGDITEGKLKRLKRELSDVVDVQHDSICIYRIEPISSVHKEEIGVVVRPGKII